MIKVIYSPGVWEQVEKQRGAADFPLRADSGLRLRRCIQTPSEKWQLTLLRTRRAAKARLTRTVRRETT